MEKTYTVTLSENERYTILASLQGNACEALKKSFEKKERREREIWAAQYIALIELKERLYTAVED